MNVTHRSRAYLRTVIAFLVLSAFMVGCADSGGDDPDLGSATTGTGADEGGGGEDPTGNDETTSEADSTGSAPESVDMGALAPQTGAAAGFGTQVIQGLEHWANVRSEGETGAATVEVDLHFEDNGEGPTQAASAYSRLRQQFDVPVVFSSLTTPTQAFLTQATEDEVVVMNAGLGPEVADASDFLFSTQLNIAVAAPAAVGYAVENVDLSSGAVLYRNDDYGQGGLAAFGDALEAAGVSVVAEEAFAAGETDFQTQATSIVGADPDVVAIIGFGQEIANSLQALERAGYSGIFLSDSGGGQPEILEFASEVAADRLFYTEVSWDPENPVNDTATRFIETFRDAYDADPTSFEVVYYEAGQVIDAAMAQLVQDGSDINGSNLREAIAGTESFTTVTGEISFGTGQLASRGVSVLSVEGGEFVVVEDLPLETVNEYMSAYGMN